MRGHQFVARKSVDFSTGKAYISAMEFTRDEMVGALLRDDARYDGRFYFGVTTTGIYCIPSCKAKAPRLKNVVFFRNREAAIAAGFRGCLRCRSEFYPDVAPRWLAAAVSFMRRERGAKLREPQLAEAAGVDISTIRRYFRRYIQVTPMAYHRKLRLEHARSLLEHGSDYLTAAYECGYESPSGFRDAFRKEFGFAPGRKGKRS